MKKTPDYSKNTENKLGLKFNGSDVGEPTKKLLDEVKAEKPKRSYSKII